MKNDASMFADLVQHQRDFFCSNITLDINYRLQTLDSLKQSLHKHEDELYEALYADLGKSKEESYFTEIGMVFQELSHIRKHLRKWAKPQHVATPLFTFPSRGFIYSEPFGVVLVMSPWNYPINLTFCPLIAAIAAGNCCIIKPSAYSPHTSNLLSRIIAECFPPEYCFVAEGGREANSFLLEQHFDYIFFTGSAAVGRLVMESASRFLTPVSLELGGKSPVIVDETANIKFAAKRIIYGKFLNSGQTCIAPDYVYVQEQVKEELISAMIGAVREYYPNLSAIPGSVCIDRYPHIINDKHFHRILNLMQNETIVYGGGCNELSLTIEPTILTDVTWESPVMQEEIFGPLLPVLTYSKLDELLALLKTKDKPLAHYLFSTNKQTQKKIMKEFTFGGGCINDAVMHVSVPKLPFGGVGTSGMGLYHGKESFLTFSHRKSILKRAAAIDFSIRYRPYNDRKISKIKKIL